MNIQWRDTQEIPTAILEYILQPALEAIGEKFNGRMVPSNGLSPWQQTLWQQELDELCKTMLVGTIYRLRFNWWDENRQFRHSNMVLTIQEMYPHWNDPDYWGTPICNKPHVEDKYSKPHKFFTTVIRGDCETCGEKFHDGNHLE